MCNGYFQEIVTNYFVSKLNCQEHGDFGYNTNHNLFHISNPYVNVHLRDVQVM